MPAYRINDDRQIFAVTAQFSLSILL